MQGRWSDCSLIILRRQLRRSLAQPLYDAREQVAAAHAVQGRERVRLAQPEPPELGHLLARAVELLDLVDAEKHLDARSHALTSAARSARCAPFGGSSRETPGAVAGRPVAGPHSGSAELLQSRQALPE